MMNTKQLKVHYQFHGCWCMYQHREIHRDNLFDEGWELLTVAFRAEDWFSGSVNSWIKDKCASLDIPWLDFPPKSRVTPTLATLFGVVSAENSLEEERQSKGAWAALQSSGSIFDDDHCSTPWCSSCEPILALFSRFVDVTVHAPTDLVNQLLMDLDAWNRDT